jgi:hypothetical protein
MRTYALLAVLLPASLIAGDVVDRVAVTVDSQMIPLSRVRNAARITAFLNREPLDLSPARLREAAERLIDQTLLLREMETAAFAMPDQAEVTAMIEDVRSLRMLEEAEFRNQYERYGISEAALRDYFRRQLAILRFIDFRFSPGVLLPEAEVQRYYIDVFAPEWIRRNGAPPPPLEQIRLQVEQALRARRTNEELDRWLRAERARSRIRFQPGVFQ